MTIQLVFSQPVIHNFRFIVVLITRHIPKITRNTMPLKVCKDNNIQCEHVKPEYFKEEPYWYVRDGWILEITKYFWDSEQICSTWTVQDFIENHTVE